MRKQHLKPQLHDCRPPKRYSTHQWNTNSAIAVSPITAITATRLQPLSDTAMAPKVTEAANIPTGTAHIHSRSTHIPQLSGYVRGLAAPPRLLPCSMLLL